METPELKDQLVLWVMRETQDHREPQGPQDQQDRLVHLVPQVSLALQEIRVNKALQGQLVL